jgi:hypothetical protein
LALHTEGHVGYYVGNGYAIEWRGFAHGCVKTKVESRCWTHWYALPMLNYPESVRGPSDSNGSNPAPQAPIVAPPAPAGTKHVVTVSNGAKVNIRVGNGEHFARLAAVPPGSTFEHVATAENGWHALVMDARVGWVSGKYSRII